MSASAENLPSSDDLGFFNDESKAELRSWRAKQAAEIVEQNLHLRKD